MADGTYPETTLLNAPIPNGSGQIAIHGNPTTPNLVKLVNTGNGSCINISGGSYYFDGVSFQSTQAIPSDMGDALWVTGAGQAWVAACGFYNSASSHMRAGPGGGGISVSGPIYIYGNALVHGSAIQNGTITHYPAPLPTLNVMNAVNIGTFAEASGGGQFTAAYAAINLNQPVTGMKYNAQANGVISTGGRGVNYLPGNTPGVIGTGGQYV